MENKLSEAVLREISRKGKKNRYQRKYLSKRTGKFIVLLRFHRSDLESNLYMLRLPLVKDVIVEYFSSSLFLDYKYE
jgi:hypothetical protein